MISGSNATLTTAAHQDVVPAETSLEKWTYPPFKGVFDGKTIWGRGRCDSSILFGANGQHSDDQSGRLTVNHVFPPFYSFLLLLVLWSPVRIQRTRLLPSWPRSSISWRTIGITRGQLVRVDACECRILHFFRVVDSPPSSRHMLVHPVLAFGFDEEIGGPQGAFTIGQHLLEQYGENGVSMIVDEGGAGIETLYGKVLVLPGTGEKGNISPSVKVEAEGGHS